MNLKLLNRNGKLQIPESPLMCFLDLTECCNLRCWFCYNGVEPHNEIADYDDILIVLDELHNSGCNEVTYLGGEPTLHPQFFDILDYADSIGMCQSMVSNGQIIDTEFAKRLSKYKDFEVGISIHSADKMIQNKISGKEKSFCNIERAIESLEEYGISWYSQTSLIKDNYLKLHKLRDYLLSKGKPCRMDLSRMVSGKIISEQFLNEEEYTEVFKQIHMMDLEELPVRIEAFPRCWMKMISEKHNLNYEKVKRTVRPCYAWTAQISVDIHGNVRLCPTGGKVAGNILDEGVAGIWKNNKVIQEFQSFEWQNKECLECSDFIYCVGACKMTCGEYSPTPDEYIKKGGKCNASINE